MNESREARVTRIAIAATLATTVLAGLELFGILRERVLAREWLAAAAEILLILIAAGMVYGSLVYQFTRLGYFRQRLRHEAPPSETIVDALFDRPAAPVVLLVPSYKEDPRVVRQALLSAALQDYPTRRVVLLIDDPPAPEDPNDGAALENTRRLVRNLHAEFARAAAPFLGALRDSEARLAASPLLPPDEKEKLALHCERAAFWFRRREESIEVRDHTDRLFAEKILACKRETLLRTAAELRAAPGAPDRDSWTGARIARQYRRLASLFDVEITSFERKRYENLPHEPNKAMNLNSYIALLGRNLRQVIRDGKLHLETPSRILPTHSFPDAKYIVTLDADSFLLPEYTARLVSIMEQEGNERLAVAQTPYSAVPEAPGMIERIAGATTDIQYIIHQGFSHYDAAYWVGANAVLRKEALDDIRVLGTERGHTVAKYIQDRTVIEDTESTVDLVSRGWRLYNYPERLSYSATPPDFGALLIQRRRWANGGLLILPKLVRHLLPRLWRPRLFLRGLMQVHYLVSVAVVNTGLLLAILLPFDKSMRTAVLPLTALPYFLLYARDLKGNGYRSSDVFRVYALNLMLVFVNLAGVYRSLEQALTERKAPFGRTPKVRGRTSAPSVHLAAIWLITAYCFLGFVTDTLAGRMVHALFSLTSGLIFAYALRHFLGVRNTLEDLFPGFSSAWSRPLAAEVTGTGDGGAEGEALDVAFRG